MKTYKIGQFLDLPHNYHKNIIKAVQSYSEATGHDLTDESFEDVLDEIERMEDANNIRFTLQGEYMLREFKIRNI